MSREIKFRVWIDKKMSEFGLFSMDGGYCKPAGTTIDGDYDSEKGVVMQFTGLKDKNSKDIYEGDIVQCFNRPYAGDLDQTYKPVLKDVVIFKDGKFTIEFDEYEPGKNRAYLRDCVEVVGNIYENSELLK